MPIMNGKYREIKPLLHKKRDSPAVDCYTPYLFAAISLIVAYITFISTGLWCTKNPPSRRLDTGGFCFEVVRHALYTEVILLVGTPPREYHVLLRFDKAETVASNIHLYSNEAYWSSTLECEQGSCTDVIMMSKQESRVRVLDEFRLSSRSEMTDIEYALGLDGSFTLNSNGGYHLGSHRICPSSVSCDEMGEMGEIDNEPEVATYDRLDIVWSEGAMYTTSDSMVNGRWKKAMARRSGCEGLIRIFPSELMAPHLLFSTALERMFLEKTINEIYQTYELGTVTCKENSPATQGHHYGHYSRDNRVDAIIADTCASHSYCRSEASVSYTHVTTLELVVVRANQSGCIGIRPEPSLDEITYAASNGHTMNLAWLRLFLMLFAAAIVYVRSSDVNVKVDTIFVRCIQTIDGGKATDTQPITMERAVLAFVAASTRLIVPIVRWPTLFADGLQRVLTMEVLAGAASILHWTLLHVDCSARRFKILVFEAVPLFLGGSSAVVDVSCTTMLAFTNAPLRGGTSTFDAVVRMLTVVLLSLVCISRCFFSISCAGLVLGVHKRWPRGDLILMLTASIFWLIQTISIAVCICDLYATPTAWSFARSTHIEVGLVATTIFCIFSLLAAPTITRTAIRICEQIDDERLQSTPVIKTVPKV